MVVPALVAAVEAGATAGRAATPRVAAEGLHITLRGVPARALAHRHTRPRLNHQPTQLNMDLGVGKTNFILYRLHGPFAV